MTVLETTQAFKDALHVQSLLLENLSLQEARLQVAVLEKDWTALEASVREMRDIADRIATCEMNRNAAYLAVKSALGLKPDDSFYDVLSRMPILERQELAALYRQLRIGVAKVRSITDGIDAYVTASVGTMREVLDELFPERKGKIYSRTGSLSPADQQSLVVNHRL